MMDWTTQHRGQADAIAARQSGWGTRDKPEENVANTLMMQVLIDPGNRSVSISLLLALQGGAPPIAFDVKVKHDRVAN